MIYFVIIRKEKRKGIKNKVIFNKNIFVWMGNTIF